ncbi:MAG: G1 family glutamic endopeptidase [Acidimicrobiales bacterium]|jgi:hypothetical protein
MTNPLNPEPSAVPLPQGGASNQRGRITRSRAVIGLVAVAAVVAGVITITQGQQTPQNPKSLAQAASWNSTSDNWSGYAETTAQTGQKYTEATATFTVPSVATMSSTNRVGCAALWTGIGGATSKDLIQLGTDSCSNSSQTGYFAWYEILPAAGTPVPSLQIQPGDRVVASLQLQTGGTTANTSALTVKYDALTQLIRHLDPSFGSSDIIERLRQLLVAGSSRLQSEPWWPRVSTELRSLFSSPTPPASSAQMWKLTFQVTSPSGTVQNWTKTLPYTSSLSSAEWITEAPTASTGIEPLPNYGVAHFFSAGANSGTPAFTPENQILLGDPNGQASVPSPPVAPSDLFNTCYFPTHQVTACAAP